MKWKRKDKERVWEENEKRKGLVREGVVKKKRCMKKIKIDTKSKNIKMHRQKDKIKRQKKKKEKVKREKNINCEQEKRKRKREMYWRKMQIIKRKSQVKMKKKHWSLGKSTNKKKGKEKIKQTKKITA